MKLYLTWLVPMKESLLAFMDDVVAAIESVARLLCGDID